MVGFEVIEHTADVGIIARGESPEEMFEQASLGLFDIMGAWDPGEGETIEISLQARDLGALLVDWLNELLYIRDTRDAIFAGLSVDDIRNCRLRGWIRVAPRQGELEGTAVKAVTHHQLKVEELDEVWSARLFVDV